MPETQTRTIHEAARDVPVREEVDVLVCGGGSSGICAALTAARLGLKPEKGRRTFLGLAYMDLSRTPPT